MDDIKTVNFTIDELNLMFHALRFLHDECNNLLENNDPDILPSQTEENIHIIESAMYKLKDMLGSNLITSFS